MFQATEYTFFKPNINIGVTSTPAVNTEKREIIVDSGASLHMLSMDLLTPQEQETNRKSEEPIVPPTASGTAFSSEEVAVYVNDLDMFIVV